VEGRFLCRELVACTEPAPNADPLDQVERRSDHFLRPIDLPVPELHVCEREARLDCDGRIDAPLALLPGASPCDERLSVLAQDLRRRAHGQQRPNLLRIVKTLRGADVGQCDIAEISPPVVLHGGLKRDPQGIDHRPSILGR
jgi:hypothetical protein